MRNLKVLATRTVLVLTPVVIFVLTAAPPVRRG